MKKAVKPILIIVLLSVLIELFGFNYNYFASKSSTPQSVSYTAGEDLKQNGKNKYLVPTISAGKIVATETNDNVEENDKYFIEIKNINKPVKYMKLDIATLTDDAAANTKMIIYGNDEGYNKYYKMGEVSTWDSFDKSKYIRLHNYGKVNSIKISFKENNSFDKAKYDNSSITVKSLEINSKVPMFFSLTRLLVIIIILIVLWSIRPSSTLFNTHKILSNVDTVRRTFYRKILIMTVVAANIVLIYLVCTYCPLNVNIELNPTHYQYFSLVKSLLNGKASLDVSPDILQKLAGMDNPYDYYERKKVLGDSFNEVCDMSYFNGNIYVYFGIFPCLLLYMPYYLLTGGALPSYLGAFICCAMAIVASFLFISKVIKYYFKSIPFGVYLLLSLILANCSGVLLVAIRPDFYSIVIIMGIALSLFGLTAFVSAAGLWKKENKDKMCNKKINRYLFVGAIFMALVAATRPQMLIGSFVAFPLFLPLILKSKPLFCKENIKRAFSFAIPYIIVAAGLMYYNYIRFDSPFDFGASYNLTINDVTLRGFVMGRLPIGIYMYLFQLPKITLDFPFVNKISVDSAYVGKTIYESMCGGAFFTNIFLLLLIFLNRVKDTFKSKNLFYPTILCLVASLVIVVFDTEMGGLIGRYTVDFLWLLFIPSILVFLQLYENAKTSEKKKRLILILGILFAVEIAFTFFYGIERGEIKLNYPDIYNSLINFFS